MLQLGAAGYTLAALGLAGVYPLAIGCLGKKKAGMVGFGGALVATTVPTWLLAAVLQCLQAFLSPRCVASVVITVQSLLWRVALGVSPWIRCTMEGCEEYSQKFGVTGRPVCLVCNHTSFLDTMLVLTQLPISRAGKVRMIVSQHLKSMPIIGRICTTMGHLSVPFKSTADGVFDVDKDKVAKVMEEFEAHLLSGGICAWFPEGAINTGDCSKVATFRGGGFKICVRNDVEIWCTAVMGNATCWPKSAPLGGYPSSIASSVFQLCASSKEFLAASEAAKDDEGKQAIFLANSAQKAIQDELDRFAARGFKAGDNTREARPKQAQQ